MARKRRTKTITVPKGVTATYYNRATKTYVSVRMDGSITVGQFSQPGVNVRAE